MQGAPTATRPRSGRSGRAGRRRGGARRGGAAALLGGAALLGLLAGQAAAARGPLALFSSSGRSKPQQVSVQEMARKAGHVEDKCWDKAVIPHGSPAEKLEALLAANPFDKDGKVGPEVEAIMKDPGTGKPVVAMVDTSACKLLYLAGQAVTDHSLVEFGTWLGLSSKCIAAGMVKGGAPGDNQYAFDRFELTGSALKKVVKTPHKNLKVGSDYQHIWKNNVHPVNPAAHHVKIMVDEVLPSHYDHKSIDVFIIDTATTYPGALLHFGRIIDQVKVGSVVIFSDFLYCPNKGKVMKCTKDHGIPVWIYTEYIATCKMKLVHMSPTDIHGAFLVTAPLGREGLEFGPRKYTKAQWTKYYREARAYFAAFVSRHDYTEERRKRYMDSLSQQFANIGGI